MESKNLELIKSVYQTFSTVVATQNKNEDYILRNAATYHFHAEHDDSCIYIYDIVSHAILYTIEFSAINWFKLRMQCTQYNDTMVAFHEGSTSHNKIIEKHYLLVNITSAFADIIYKDIMDMISALNSFH